MRPILIVTYYWPPAGGPGVQRWLKMAKYLPENGFKPIILTVDYNKATYPLKDESLLGEVPKNLVVEHTGTNELFNLYQKASGRKEVPFSGFANETDRPGPRQKVSKWLRGNLFIPDPRRGWNKLAIKKGIELIQMHDIEYLVTTSPPHSTQLIGLTLKKKFPKLKWLADLRDPWTDIYYYDQFYPTKVAKSYDRFLEKQVLIKADFVSVVSESMRRLLSAKIGNNEAQKFKVVPNGYDEDDFNAVSEKETKAKKERFNIVYTGTITQQYKIGGFISALQELKKAYELSLIFVGNRDEVLQKKLEQLDFVELHNSVPHAESTRFIQQADALFLAIPSIDKNEGIITGKIFEYFAAQKPIIGIGPLKGDAATLLEETDSGRLFDYEDANGIKAFVLQLLEGKTKFQFNSARFSRKAITAQLCSTFNL